MLCDNSYRNSPKSYRVKITANCNIRKFTWSTGCAKYQLMGILAFGLIVLHTDVCTWVCTHTDTDTHTDTHTQIHTQTHTPRHTHKHRETHTQTHTVTHTLWRTPARKVGPWTLPPAGGQGPPPPWMLQTSPQALSLGAPEQSPNSSRPMTHTFDLISGHYGGCAGGAMAEGFFFLKWWDYSEMIVMTDRLFPPQDFEPLKSVVGVV